MNFVCQLRTVFFLMAVSLNFDLIHILSRIIVSHYDHQ